VQAHLDRGGAVIADADLGTNLPGADRQRLLEHPGTRIVTPHDYRSAVLEGERQVQLDGNLNLAINLQRVEDGVAVHIIRYDYDEEIDAVPLLESLDISIRLPEHYDRASAFDQGNRLMATLTREGDTHRLSLRDVPLYSIVLLHSASTS
jgi:hypothetical protein